MSPPAKFNTEVSGALPDIQESEHLPIAEQYRQLTCSTEI
jgi:hypothetical protein